MRYDHLATVRWFAGTSHGERSARWYRSMATRLGLASFTAPTEGERVTLRALESEARAMLEKLGGDPYWP